METIPGPLKDRMEVITLSGYVADEKRKIASQYLLPQAQEASGLTDNQMTLNDDAIDRIIHSYCRENGVRHLKKKIEQIYRKGALQVVERQSSLDSTPHSPIVVRADNLKSYIGSPLYTSDRLFPQTPEGVVMGLAYNSLGGATLYIESVIESPVTKHSKPAFSLTGNLGSVMKESARIAQSYARHFIGETEKENAFFEHACLHLHVPEGATPKDGPSAGIAMCTSLVSLALNRPVIPDLAMTGELTLTGKVLKIGGVKEKVMSAQRQGVRHVILPRENEADFEELSDNVKQGITPHFVNTYADVFRIAFGQERNNE